MCIHLKLYPACACTTGVKSVYRNCCLHTCIISDIFILSPQTACFTTSPLVLSRYLETHSQKMWVDESRMYGQLAPCHPMTCICNLSMCTCDELDMFHSLYQCAWSYQCLQRMLIDTQRRDVLSGHSTFRTPLSIVLLMWSFLHGLPSKQAKARARVMGVM